MQHETMHHSRPAGDSGETNRSCSPRPRNNLVPLYRPIQRYGSRIERPPVRFRLG